jgi:hypothetical protein
MRYKSEQSPRWMITDRHHGHTSKANYEAWCSFYQKAKQFMDLRELMAPMLEGVRHHRDYLMALCPHHEETTPSLMVQRDHYYCFGCGTHGDGVNWYEGLPLTRADALVMISQQTGIPLPSMMNDGWEAIVAHPRPRVPEADTQAGDSYDANRSKLERILVNSTIVTHPSALPLVRYLDARGLAEVPCPTALRFHPELSYHHTVSKHESVFLGNHPAILALVSGPDGELVNIQRIYLTPDGEKLQPSYMGESLAPKKLMTSIRPGAIMGAAVRLFEAGRVLAVAEGVETALSYHSLSGLPVWACLSAKGLERVVIPDFVDEVVIAADRDANGVGLESAVKLARRMMDLGKEVRIHLPLDLMHGGNTDWNDVLLLGC